MAKGEGLEFSPEHTNVRFGNSSEFTFRNIIEMFDNSGEVEELALFFYDADGHQRAFHVYAGDKEEIAADEDGQPIVQLPMIDPESVIGLMCLPSQDILEISQPVPEDHAE